MAQSIGIKSQADGSAFVYIEDASGNSLAFGSDNTANTFVLNTSSVPNIIPNDATSNIQFDPATNGDITFMPNGTGNSVFATNDVSIVDGNLLLPATSNAGDIGCIFSGGSRVISFPDDFNIYIGKGIGGVGTYPNVVGVVYNIAIGSEGTFASLTGAASNNIAIGRSVLQDLLGNAGMASTGNIAIGSVSLAQLTDGSNNIAIGVGSLGSILTGSNNICIAGGSSYTSTESNNICIGTGGIVGDNNIIRIGDTTPASIDETYIAGIYGVTPTDPPQMVIIDDNGQLGSQAIPSGEITITGDTGGPLTSSSFTFTGGVTNTGTLSFSGSGSTMSLLVQDANQNLIIGEGGDIPSSGASNVVIGHIPFLSGNPTSASFNTGVGYQSFNALTTGSRNSGFGQQPLLFITSGSNNLAMGTYQTGVNYTSSESNNLLLTSPGVVGENNTIRIGTQGAGDHQQNRAFIAGIVGAINAGASTVPYIETATGQLATTPGGAVTMNTGTQSLSISSDASATTVNVATGGAAKTVTVGSTTSTSSLALKYGTSDFSLASATGTVMSAADTGEINYPLQPAFFAYLNAAANNVTGAATIYTLGSGTALTIVFDQNGDMNTNGTFTAPVTGRYNLSGQILVVGCTIAATANIRITTSNRTYFTQFARAAGPQNITASECTITDMDAADTATVSIQVIGEAGDTDDLSAGSGGGPDCWLSGFLVC